jgi:hypothetical protein
MPSWAISEERESPSGTPFFFKQVKGLTAAALLRMRTGKGSPDKRGEKN